MPHQPATLVTEGNPLLLDDSPPTRTTPFHQSHYGTATTAEVVPEKIEEFLDPAIKLYKKRWLMLAMFCSLSMSNAVNWIAFASVATLAEEYYNVSAFEISMLSTIYMIVYAIGAFSAGWLVERKGLRTGLIISALLNLSGAIIRVLPYPIESTTDEATGYHYYALALFGQTLAATAQLFILSIPPILAQSWFGVDERVKATAIGALCNQFGIAIGFYLPPAIIGNDSSKFPFLMLVEAAISLLVCFPIILFFQSKPRKPPSHSQLLSEKVEEHDFLQAALLFLENRGFMILLISYSICFGGFAAICTVLEPTLSEFGYSTTQSGLYGSLNVSFGMLGAYVFGHYADKYKKLHYFVFLALLGSFLSMVWFSAAIGPGREWMMAVSQSLLGFFMTALIPVSLDLAVEITYPQPEALSTTALMAFSQVFGVVLVQVMTAMLDHDPKASNWFLTGALGFGCLLFAFFKGDTKRSNIESAHAGENITTPLRSPPVPHYGP
eukprot:TRINITY_DN8598_c0_g2_i1.p1 TRINITY_DN8598_c0_g2~~TRINITY_DN8598_c0_g2_i1.p1  ORF type:complete len:496 (+),score=90.89 TRINITY_DN8598_c0_g2_i1:44-1531(+)